MKRLALWGHDADVAAFVAALSPLEKPNWPQGYTACGILKGDGSLVGGVVFSDWREQFGTLEISAAGVSSYIFGPQIVSELGSYVFGQLGAYRVWARTGIRNERAKRLLKGLGFTQEAVLSHHYGPREHASQWRLLKPEWERRRGPEVRQAA